MSDNQNVNIRKAKGRPMLTWVGKKPLTRVRAPVERNGETLRLEVTDVLSPSIVKRLNMEEGLFRAQIDDWHAVVDAVMIDSNHDGEVFNTALSDVPEKKPISWPAATNSLHRRRVRQWRSRSSIDWARKSSSYGEYDRNDYA